MEIFAPASLPGLWFLGLKLTNLFNVCLRVYPSKRPAYPFSSKFQRFSRSQDFPVCSNTTLQLTTENHSFWFPPARQFCYAFKFEFMFCSRLGFRIDLALPKRQDLLLFPRYIFQVHFRIVFKPRVAAFLTLSWFRHESLFHNAPALSYVDVEVKNSTNRRYRYCSLI